MRKGNGFQWLIRPGVDTGDEPTLTIWLSQCFSVVLPTCRVPPSAHNPPLF